MRKALLAASLCFAHPLGAQQADRWMTTWAPSTFAAPPKPPADSIDRVPTYADRTLRQIVRTTLGGNRLRLRLTNEFGEQALVIGAAHVAVHDTGAAIRAGTDHAITFDGHPSVTLRRGGVIVSDPVEMEVPSLGDLAISLWVKDTARASTRHPLGLQTGYVSSPGDFTRAASFRADTTIAQWLWLGGVDVVNAKATGVIVTLGNSITDGARSSTDSNSRWPDVLAHRLLTSTEPAKAVVNAGIAGNRLLSRARGASGTHSSALARFDHDVLSQPGVTHVILLEGINDLNIGTGSADPRDSVSAGDVIFGYQQLIRRAHERGLVIFGATLTPMGNVTGGAPGIIAAEDAKRQAVNSWIRTSGAFDGVIDFDAITRDPAQPNRFLPAYDSGDHLHPSDAGYKALGESIALTLFRDGIRRRGP